MSSASRDPGAPGAPGALSPEPAPARGPAVRSPSGPTSGESRPRLPRWARVVLACFALYATILVPSLGAHLLIGDGGLQAMPLAYAATCAAVSALAVLAVWLLTTRVDRRPFREVGLRRDVGVAARAGPRPAPQRRRRRARQLPARGRRAEPRHRDDVVVAARGGAPVRVGGCVPPAGLPRGAVLPRLRAVDVRREAGHGDRRLGARLRLAPPHLRRGSAERPRAADLSGPRRGLRVARGEPGALTRSLWSAVGVHAGFHVGSAVASVFGSGDGPANWIAQTVVYAAVAAVVLALARARLREPLVIDR